MAKETLAPQIGRPEKYPWARWLDGRIHTAVHMKHFTAKPKSFARIVQRKAAKKGKLAVVRIEKDNVRFQFTDRP